MPKQTHNTDPVDRSAYEATMARIQELTGATTQVQLADVLDVRQSSISDAKRRASIPPDWVLKLHKSHRAMPEWIEHGTGPRTVDDIIPHEVRRTAQAVRELRANLARMADTQRESIAIARATVDELVLSRQCAIKTLEGCGEALGVFAQQADALAQAMPGEQPVAQ